MKKYKLIIIGLGILVTGIFVGRNSINSTHNTSNEIATTQPDVHWTCAMHPQIDLPEFGTCPICGMDLIPKETNSDKSTSQNFKMTENAMVLANIETIVVGEEENTQNKLLISGSIETNTDKNFTQTAHFGGRIEQLAYQSKGDFIKRGSLIARIYSPELVTSQNEFLEAIRIKNEQPELYNAVKNKLRNWKISKNQIKHIEKTHKIIQNFALYADQSGYIDEVFVQQGNYVKEGVALYKLSNINKVWAVFEIYENDIQNIKIGEKIKISVNAFPNEMFEAKIDFINPVLDVKSRTVEVRATLVNTKHKLKPGMLIKGEIIQFRSKGKTSIFIPKSAVMWTGKRSIVYINTQVNKPIFELREIMLGNETDKGYQILSGIQKGERIVVEGTFTVDAAAQLQGKNSMMNQISKKKK